MKKRIVLILSLLFLIGVLTINQNNFGNLFKSPNVYAISDLTIDWGIGIDNVGPIFNISNFAPGQFEVRNVLVSNGASTARPVGIKAVKTAGVGDLESKLNIIISKGVVDIYGGTTGNKTLQDFINDSLGINDFISLSTLASGANETYTIKVTFDESADNTFQNTSVTFNLIFGVAIETPAECSGINFSSPTPIFGTSGNDRINGTLGNDLIFVLEGNDRVFAHGGDDCIVGGLGNDQLRGEIGNDAILGQEGNDILIGAIGNDTIFGGLDNDVIRGEVGIDNLFGNEGNDTIFGGNDNDTISGGEDNDNLHGENGVDLISGDDGTDNLTGGAQNDTLIGGLGTSDKATGQSGIDTCDAETEVSCEL